MNWRSLLFFLLLCAGCAATDTRLSNQGAAPTEHRAEQPRRGHFYNEEFRRYTNVKSDSLYSEILNRDVEYSIYLPPSYLNQPEREYPVLYYIHGFDTPKQAHKDWLTWHVDEALDAFIETAEAREMIVVMPRCFSTGIIVNWGHYERPLLVSVISFPFRAARGIYRALDDPTYLGTYGFIHRWDLTRSHYSDFFVAEFIEHVEQTHRIKRGKDFRAICGFSTGGFSALSLAFRYPAMFDSVSAHAPMLIPISPFSPEADKYFVEYDKNKRGYVSHKFTMNLLRRMFVNEAVWDANDPITLAAARDLDGLRVYIDVAEGDKRKYDVGAQKLAGILEERGVAVQFELVKGLPPTSNHTYPGFINGTLVAEHARGKTDEELFQVYGVKNVNALLNPDVQRIRRSLAFHSQHFSE
jgi:S-formylglutathione hydrolase FrmB